MASKSSYVSSSSSSDAGDDDDRPLNKVNSKKSGGVDLDFRSLRLVKSESDFADVDEDKHCNQISNKNKRGNAGEKSKISNMVLRSGSSNKNKRGNAGDKTKAVGSTSADGKRMRKDVSAVEECKDDYWNITTGRKVNSKKSRGADLNSPSLMIRKSESEYADVDVAQPANKISNKNKRRNAGDKGKELSSAADDGKRRKVVSPVENCKDEYWNISTGRKHEFKNFRVEVVDSFELAKLMWGDDVLIDHLFVMNEDPKVVNQVEKLFSSDGTVVNQIRFPIKVVTKNSTSILDEIKGSADFHYVVPPYLNEEARLELCDILLNCSDYTVCVWAAKRFEKL